MKLQFKIVGFLLIALALLHLFFPKYFKWKTDLKSMSLINQEMMVIHTFFIGLVVLLMGLLCLSSAEELIATGLGKRISLGMAIFWTLRLIIQFFGYSKKLWKGKAFETSMHILFSALWTYLSVLFWMNYFN
ncbi:MAG: hypothetical protein AAF487_12060 [Bacteroidota bacterium]